MDETAAPTATPPPASWEWIFTLSVLTVMFAVLIQDKIGTDSVMLTALTLFYISGIISVDEALKGFSSQGLLTVLVLFVVAEGLNKTGALNWYVGKLFGMPRTLAGAQLRVMVPVVVLSGFINDTPLVMVTLPIVIQWAKKINFNLRCLLMPLSFAALLGGVCTIIGTSTNLIVMGLLMERYPDNPSFTSMSLFALGRYGVPVALWGVAYIISMTPVLLIRTKEHWAQLKTSSSDTDDLLLGARLTQWSPAAGRTIKRSGLRDTGGVYLVRVKRRATGNVHTVSPEFVLEVGDILYFTGLISSFGAFCEEHGLEMITNEVEDDVQVDVSSQDVPSLTRTFSATPTADSPTRSSKVWGYEYDVDDSQDQMAPLSSSLSSPRPIAEVLSPQEIQLRQKLDTLGISLDSLMDSTSDERMRIVFNIQDSIRGEDSHYQTNLSPSASRVVVAKQEQDVIVIAIDAFDRPGLLLDISKVLARLNLELHHTEAAVRNFRSLSIWRCEQAHSTTNQDVEQIWSVVHSLFSKESGAEAIRLRGLQVLRARVRHGSRLVGKSLLDLNFRQMYKAAIVAIQKTDGKVYTEELSSVTFDIGDILVLQASEHSPLVELSEESSSKVDLSFDTSTLDADEDIEHLSGRNEKEAVWNDLEVLQAPNNGNGVTREFLTAMTVAQGSRLVGKTVEQAGIDKLPGVFLVSIDRPFTVPDTSPPVESFSTIPMTEMMTEGDVLWFSGAASEVGDLRKIPGLSLYESGQVMKINEKVQNRRLVEAVVSRNGPLDGRTVKEIKFRTVYGAAVIAVHREGRRVHELPGNIKLRAGDVLLLEAGKSFIVANKNQQDKAFTLIAEVEGSSPPRFRMLIPAVVLTVGAYVCYMLKLSSLFGTAMVAAILMVMVGVLSESEARSAVRWEIYLTIAPAFGVGQALINSGVAGAMATFLVNLGHSTGIGDAGLLGAVYIATVLISQVVANNAAAALIFPIAMEAAELAGLDLELMAFAIMLAASAAFMTPFGYQTNLMVMGPGGYNTMDFLIFGTPMQLVLALVSTVALVSPAWWLVWLVSLAVLVAVSALRVFWDRKKIGTKFS